MANWQDPQGWLRIVVARSEALARIPLLFPMPVILPEIPSLLPTPPPFQIINLVLNGGRLEVPSRDSLPGDDTPAFTGLDRYVTLIKRCWAHNPFDRPTFGEVIPELRWVGDGVWGWGMGMGVGIEGGVGLEEVEWRLGWER